MQITTVMVVVLIGWCVLTIATKGYQPVPAPTLANLKFSDDALGWLKGTIAPTFTVIAILIGLGHSLLAMSGEESLAQVNREIEYPKHRNLMRTGFVIFIYSLVFTSLVSFFAVMIIPDAERPKYFDNLISGLSIFLVGPEPLKLFFQGFVVLVGTLILSLQLSIPETREEPLNELSIRQQYHQEDRRLIPSLFVFKQSGHRRRNLVDGFWLAQESVNAGAPGFFLAIVSRKHDEWSMAAVRHALRTEY